MERTILIISADSQVTQTCIRELSGSARRYRLLTANNLGHAGRIARQSTLDAILLDESAVDSHGEKSLETAAAQLIETAPVVVAAAPQKQSDLAFLITSGAVDFVARTNQFVPVAAGLLDRRVRFEDRGYATVQFPVKQMAANFGEILRHEVNNPLTGILGNTELLLSQPDRLPPGAAERLRTIAELAVRLRETVRRLSNSYDEHHEAARPA